MSTVELTKENFDAVTTQKDITVIDFWAAWCGPCKNFAPVFAQVAKDNLDVTFAKVDIDAQTELADAFAVRSIPQIVVMKKDVVIFSQAGTLPASALQDLVNQAKAADVDKLRKEE